MKKYSILVLFCCLITTVAFAQKNPFFTVGPKIGINHSNFLANNTELNKEGIQAYPAGAFARIGFLKTYIQPEAYYNFKSTSLSIEEHQSGNTNISGNFRFNNIDVPVLIGSKLINAKIFNLRVFAGPMVSFLLKDENSTKNYNLDNYDFNNKIWGGQAGLGFDIGNITVDVRYQTKLSRISDIVEGPGSVLHFSAGLKLF